MSSHRFRRQKNLICAAAAFTLFPAVSSAETIRADTPDSDYTALSDQPQYAASGYVDVVEGETAAFGSGTLIAPDWVLTAAHVVTENETGPAVPVGDVTFGQGPTAVVFSPAADAISQVVVEPGYNGNGPSQGNDLALIQLAIPITNVAPAQLYTASLGTEIGQTATFIGYGLTGNGVTGDTGSSPGVRRGMTNVIDAFGGGTVVGGSTRHHEFFNVSQFSPNILLTDFDNPNQNDARQDNIMGSSVPTTLEGASVPGDSGGGVFVTINGQTYLTAVTDFGFSFTGNSPIGLYGDLDGYTRLSVAQSVSFLDSALITNNAWNLSTGGSWSSLPSWTNNAIPEFAGSTATFGSAIAQNSTVALDANWTVGAVMFNNTNSYTLAAGASGILTLDNGGPSATASLSDLLGAHVVSAPIALNSYLNISVANPTDSMTLSGPISGHGGLSLSGAGSLVLSAANSYAGPTTIASGHLILASAAAIPLASPLTIGSSSSTAAVQLAPGIGKLSLTSIALTAGSTVDLTNNSIAVNYTTASPVAAIAAALSSGYNSGAWTGPGIVSSSAAANPSVFSVGYADGNLDPNTAAQPNQVLVAFTLAGDASLDGSVGFADLIAVAQHFGFTGQDWADGNFTYDPSGAVGFADLILVAQNFGQSIAPQAASLSPAFSTLQLSASAAVPEPALFFPAIIGLTALLRRRSRLLQSPSDI